LQRETQTYRADLKQTVMMRGLRDPVVSEGAVYFQRPDALAFRFTQPSAEYFLMNGPDIWLKKRNKPLRHRQIGPDETQAAGDMGFLMSLFKDGGTNTRERYEVAIMRGDGELRVVLTPKQRKPRSRDPVQIENWVNADTLELARMRIEFEGGSTIAYEFHNPLRNTPLDSALFLPSSTEK
jgi:outer membrane lipoprotein-sorting protein